MLIMRSDDGCVWAHFFRTGFETSHVFVGRKEYGQRSVKDQVRSAITDRIRITVHQSMFGGESSMFPDFDDGESDSWYQLNREELEEYLIYLGYADPDDHWEFDLRDTRESEGFLAWKRARDERERLEDMLDDEITRSSRFEMKRRYRSQKTR